MPCKKASALPVKVMKMPKVNTYNNNSGTTFSCIQWCACIYSVCWQNKFCSCKRLSEVLLSSAQFESTTRNKHTTLMGVLLQVKSNFENYLYLQGNIMFSKCSPWSLKGMCVRSPLSTINKNKCQLIYFTRVFYIFASYYNPWLYYNYIEYLFTVNKSCWLHTHTHTYTRWKRWK